MSKKRVRLTQKQYDELLESRDWAARNGMDGMAQWYNDTLNDHLRRRTLPVGVVPPGGDVDDDVRR